MSIRTLACVRTSWFSFLLAAVLLPTIALAQHPNVLIIYGDDQGSIDLGCFGVDDLQTPHLDQLASGGLQLTRMYSAAPVCSASRVGLLTGRILLVPDSLPMVTLMLPRQRLPKSFVTPVIERVWLENGILGKTKSRTPLVKASKIGSGISAAVSITFHTSSIGMAPTDMTCLTTVRKSIAPESSFRD